MWVFRYFIITVILLVIVGFAIQNSYQRVDINLLNKRYIDVPLILVLFEAFAVGIFFWFVISIAHFLKVHRALSKQKRENDKLLEEITTIRNMPLQENDEKPEDSGYNDQRDAMS